MTMPSPELIVASIALFVALGGTGYVVTALPRDSVTSDQIKDGSVLPADLSPTARAASTRGAAAKGPKGEKGAKGDRGPAGAKGATGAPGARGEIGAQGPTGATGSTGPIGASGARYFYNGNGDLLGDLIAVTEAFSTGAIYIVRIGNRWWKVDSNGKLLANGGNLNWLNSNCTGPPAHIYGQSPFTRTSGAPHAVLVNTFTDGTAVAYEVPDAMTTLIVSSGTNVYYKYGDGSCHGYAATSDLYGTSALTAVALPTFIAPLTIC